MHYADTSVLVTALTDEPDSVFIRRWLVRHDDSTFISDWTLTEFAGALSRKKRAGDVDDNARREAKAGLADLSGSSLTLLTVTRAHFHDAADVCEADVGLRSGDALHIAVARDHGLTIVSRDRAMVRGARELGLEAVLLEERS